MHALLLAITYVLVLGDSNTLRTSGVNLDRAIELRDQYGSQFLWVKRGGVRYLIRDRATIDQIDRLFDETQSMRPDMDRLHDRMRPVERRETELEHKIDAISDRDEDDEEISAADQARLHDLERELRDVEAKLRVFEREEEALDKKMDAAEQEAERRMVPIVDEAIRKGLAKRE